MANVASVEAVTGLRGGREDMESQQAVDQADKRSRPCAKRPTGQTIYRCGRRRPGHEDHIRRSHHGDQND